MTNFRGTIQELLNSVNASAFIVTNRVGICRPVLRERSTGIRSRIYKHAIEERLLARWQLSPMWKHFGRMPATARACCGRTRAYNLREEFRPIAFLSPTQSSEPDPFTQVVIRSPAPLTELISRVRSAVAEVDPAIGLDFRAFETTVREGLLRERMMAALSSFFGGLATLIAAIGLYGVMSFLVMRRTNEIGIRMALGADARNVLALVLPESATLLALGLLAGTGLALAAARTADAMLFGLKSYDPGTLALAAALLAAVTGAATYLPARRAARLDPMAALREE